MDKRIPCIEVSEDFFDDDDFDVSSYGAGGDFDPRLLKQMNFADRDNNGEVKNSDDYKILVFRYWWFFGIFTLIFTLAKKHFR